MEAANAVCGDGEIDDVFDPLTQLVHASLVSVENRGGQVRYRLPNAIWECAYAQLTAPALLPGQKMVPADEVRKLAEMLTSKTAKSVKTKLLALLDH